MLPANLMAEIASDGVIDEAYRWLCRRRGSYSHNNDVWTLRWFWDQIKPDLQAQLLAGEYRFESLHLIPDSPDHVALWTARDSLVQKAMAIVLTRRLAPLMPKACYHLINNGGSKGALREVLRHLPGNAYVFRTDVKNYYAAIDHDILHSQLKEQIGDQRVLDLLVQYMRRTIYDGGLYTDVTRGIPMGCPLSPLMAAIYLKPLDDRMAELCQTSSPCIDPTSRSSRLRGKSEFDLNREGAKNAKEMHENASHQFDASQLRSGIFYVRFMDDWVVMAPTRWKLRSAVKCVNETMAQLKMEQHPDKTFVGRISRGFDFLGYRIAPAGLIGLARQSVQQTVERINRLYEQGVGRGCPSQATQLRIGQYVRRWWSWVRGGMLRACRGGDCLESPVGVLPVLRKIGEGCEERVELKASVASLTFPTNGGRERCVSSG